MLRNRGRQLRIVPEGLAVTNSPKPDPTLFKLLRRAHDRDQLPGLDIHIDPAQYMQGLVAHDVGLMNILKMQHVVSIVR